MMNTQVRTSLPTCGKHLQDEHLESEILGQELYIEYIAYIDIIY